MVAGMKAQVCYHACMPKQLTIRGVPDEVGRRLESLSRERRKSVNAIVLAILEAAVGYSERRQRLERYATWTETDRLDFESALRHQRTVDLADWT